MIRTPGRCSARRAAYTGKEGIRAISFREKRATKKFIARLGLVLFGCIIAIGIGEIGARIYLALPAGEDTVYIRDRDAGYRIRPHYGNVPPDDENYINNIGFRDRDYQREKIPGTYRIIGIGDSFVYGAVPRNDHFLKVAGARLAETFAPESIDVEMILMGLGGYGPENYVGALKSFALPYEPDLIVLNFFVGNDVTGIPIRGEVFRGKLYYVGSHDPWLHVARQSRLFMMVETAFLTRVKVKLKRWRSGGRKQRTPKEKAPIGAADSDGSYEITSIFAEIQAKRLPVYGTEYQKRVENLWREAEGYLEEFDLLCREAGVPWILLLIPAEIQVDPAVRTLVFDELGRDPEAYDFDLPQRRLHTYASARGIPTLDPLPLMRENHRPEERLYIPNDTHWNVRGNRIVGELLADFITQM